jgi:hypothetical protein
VGAGGGDNQQTTKEKSIICQVSLGTIKKRKKYDECFFLIIVENMLHKDDI